MSTGAWKRIQNEIKDITQESHSLINIMRVQEDDIIILEEIE